MILHTPLQLSTSPSDIVLGHHPCGSDRIVAILVAATIGIITTYLQSVRTVVDHAVAHIHIHNVVVMIRLPC